ncbi:MAG TPA: GNVR domain-containing protein [Azospirillaceae bacterium]|nr:GNVR domain-containing protein [Azospirillaceae bacterium]HRQ80799.1 GNVR domain-containing protein [Azospirillaceae bacterium]
MATIDDAQASFREQFIWVRRVLWRGKLTILTMMAVFVIPAALYLQQATPRFSAAAQVLVVSDEADTLLDNNSAARWRQTDVMVQTEAAILTSRPLIRRLSDKLDLDRDPEFNLRLRPPDPVAAFIANLNPVNWLPDAWRGGQADLAGLSAEARATMDEARIAGRVLSRLDVDVQRRSQLINLRFESENREKAARIVNALAELYVLDRLEARFDETRRVTGWLTERLEALRRDVAAADQAVETHRAAHGLARRNERQQTMLEQQLTELNSRLVLARADLAQKRARFNQVRTLSGGGAAAVASATDVLQSSLIQRLREQETTLQRELSEAAKTYGDRHPRLIGLRADMGELRSKIALEIERVAASVENEVRVAEVGVSAIENQLNDLRRNQERAGEASIRMRELEREAEASRELYEAFLSRFKRSAEQEQIQRANARILSPADVPLRPSYPRKQSILLLAAFIGLVAGVVLLLALDLLDGLIRTAADAEIVSGLPVLAVAPLLPARSSDGKPEEMVIRKPRSALADGLRSLRTAIELSTASADDAATAEGEAAGRGKIIMVTSSTPQEGKTFISVSLARLYARLDKRILLVDCDVHRARAHAALGLPNQVGLMEVAAGVASLEDALQRDALTPLDVLTAGVGPEGSAEVLTSQAARDLLARLAMRYDRIIIDSPPVLAVSDVRALAPLADSVVYLIRWNATPRDAVRNGLRVLRDSGARLAGVALSQVDARRYDRYAYGDYGSYYGRYANYYGE